MRSIRLCGEYHISRGGSRVSKYGLAGSPAFMGSILDVAPAPLPEASGVPGVESRESEALPDLVCRMAASLASRAAILRLVGLNHARSVNRSSSTLVR